MARAFSQAIGIRATGDGDPTARLEADLIAAANLDHIAATLQHADDRSASRARNLTRINGQLVRAIDADPSAGSRREHQRRGDIVAAAGRYLHVLDVALRHDRTLLAECAAEAERLRGAAVIAEARLEALATAPVSVSPPVEIVVPPVTVAVDPVEQWLRQVEERRPLIVTDGSRFMLAKGEMPVGIGAALAQGQLKILYGRQQREIDDVVRQLPANRLSIGTRTVEGRKRHYLDRVDPGLARSFFRYQDSAEIKAAIEDIFAGRIASADRPQPPAGHVPVGIANEPSAAKPAPLVLPPMRQPVPVIAPPPVVGPTRPAEPVAEAPTHLNPKPSVVAPPMAKPAMPPPPLDPARIARDLVDRNVPLTFDENETIDAAALLAAKVDPSLIGTLQNNAFLAGRVGKQVEEALAQVQAHATAKPLNLIRKGEQITLGGDAPAALIELSHFHGRAPLMQEPLRRLHDELNAPAAEQPPPAVVPVEKRPAPAKVEQAPSDGPKPKPPSSADILHGEAARQAALRAAWQRGG